MRIKFMYQGAIIYQGSTADLISRLNRACMLGHFHPETGDEIQTLCTPENTKRKGAVCDIIKLPPLGTPEKQIEVTFDSLENPLGKLT